MTEPTHTFLEEEGVIVIVEPGAYQVPFFIFDAAQTTDEDPVIFIMDDGAPYPLETWKDRFWVWGGHVKWDGCCNWQTNPECMAHFCGPSQGTDLSKIWETIYALAADSLTEAAPDWLREPKP